MGNGNTTFKMDYSWMESLKTNTSNVYQANELLNVLSSTEETTNGYTRLPESLSILSQISKSTLDFKLPHSSTKTSRVDFSPTEEDVSERQHQDSGDTNSTGSSGGQNNKKIDGKLAGSSGHLHSKYKSTESVSAVPLEYNKDVTVKENNKEILVHIKLAKLECCSKKTVWMYRTEKFSKQGQTDFLLLVEYLATDNCQPPADVVELFRAVLKKTLHGETVKAMQHTIFETHSFFLGSHFISGVLYFTERGQCFHQLVSPADYGSLLLCRLVHLRELKYLKHAPLRLMIRLGQEDGVFPCGLISSRFRPPVFQDNDNSMFALFKDIYPEINSGCIPRLPKSHISLERGQIIVNLSRETHHDLIRLLSTYAPNEDGLLAFSSDLCEYADGHLVAIHKAVGHRLGSMVFASAKAGTKPTVVGVTYIAISALTDNKSLGVTGTVAAVVEDGIVASCKKEEFVSLLQSLKIGNDCSYTCNWFFGIKNHKIMKTTPIKFIWRAKSGD